MTDPRWQPFLDAVLAAPIDDLPRLIFADALEDAGETERAEFIRVQVELARTKEPAIRAHSLGLSDEQYDWYDCTGDCRLKPWTKSGTLCRYHELQHREYELFRAGACDLRPGGVVLNLTVLPFNNLGHRGLLNDSPWQFIRRGFGEAVRCDWQFWRTRADRLRAACPLADVTLTTWPEISSWPDESLLEIYERSGWIAPAVHWEPSLARRWPGIRFNLPQTDWQGNVMRDVTWSYTDRYGTGGLSGWSR